LRERGFPSLRNPNLRGDEFIEVKISLPKVISEETKTLLREFEKLNPESPRKTMGIGLEKVVRDERDRQPEKAG
jgi:DnaJ-class molecular chaperone